MWDILCGDFLPSCHSFGSVLFASNFHGCHPGDILVKFLPWLNRHGHQTHRAKILPWFGLGPNWSPFPALPQPLHGLLYPQTPMALSDLQAAL